MTCLFADNLPPENTRTIADPGAQQEGLSSANGTVSQAGALSSMSKLASEVTLERGIPTLPKRVVKKMLAWEQINRLVFRATSAAAK